MIAIIRTNKRHYLNKKDFIDIEDILRDLKADYESFNLPETFEELKKLCSGLKGIRFGREGEGKETEYICIDDSIYFFIDGTITLGFEPFAYERTPTQMYRMIISLTEGQ